MYLVVASSATTIPFETKASSIHIGRGCDHFRIGSTTALIAFILCIIQPLLAWCDRAIKRREEAEAQGNEEAEAQGNEEAETQGIEETVINGSNGAENQGIEETVINGSNEAETQITDS